MKEGVIDIMKVFVLSTNGHKIAMCQDKFLIELFIVQRKLINYDVSLRKAKKEIKTYDTYLIYYYGYAITMREMEFINVRGMEYLSDLDFTIMELRAFIEEHRKYLKKKEIDTIKNTIKILKNKKKNKNLIFSKEMIECIIEEPGMMNEYLDNLEAFKNCMEGDF